MKIIKGSDNKFTEPSAVTIGKFDGLHIGHRKLIRHTLNYKKDGYKSVVFTFDISAGEALKEDGRKYIYTADEKRIMLSKTGADILVECPFDRRLMHMTPEEFFKDVLIDKINAKAVIVGEDFRFGYQRAGDTDLLFRLCSEYKIALEVIKKECVSGYEAASTLIRSELLKGNMEAVNDMLGCPYTIYAAVEHGRKLGRTLDMPTVNTPVSPIKLIPPNGVYASLVKYKDRIYKGVTNIGLKPTIEGMRSVGAETYIFDFDADIYGEDIAVGLLSFRRKEVKFGSLSELKEQMHKDKEDAFKYIEKSFRPDWGELFG